ncbi:MAG: hypothetical protein JNJ77_06485 [Planctomycetia bacterium]|nr:hypothetical protein [Planctomycetia bacterium]
MKREDWIAILQKVPENLHDQVVFSLSTGIDVYTQRLLQQGEEMLLLRGRLGGSDEGERIFMIPWTEIKLMFFSRPVEDEILFRVFGDLIGGVRKSMAAKAKKDEENEEAEEMEEEARPMPVRLPAASVQAIADASPKSGVSMDELRSRLLQQRRPPPNTQTNKPGPGTKSQGKH